MSVLDLYFGIPSGAVWGNLVASLIWAPLAAAGAVWRARVHLARHLEAMHVRHDEAAAQIAQLHAKVDALHRQRRAAMPPADAATLYDTVQREALRRQRLNPGMGGWYG